MKNNIGFTILELLASITILAIIMLISTLAIGNIITSIEKEAVKQNAMSISRAAKVTYSNEYIENNKVGTAIFFYNNGVETSNITGLTLDYEGNKNLDGYVVVKGDKTGISIHDGEYCSFKDYNTDEIIITTDSKEICIKEIYKPSIVFLNGNTVNHEINTPIVVQDLVDFFSIVKEATKPTSQVLKFNGTPIGSINTNTLGTYTIDYTIVEQGYSTTNTLTINVVDTIKPAIVGANDISITGAQVASFNPMVGITATDNSGGAVTITYDSYALSGVGVYFITYRAVDSSGNTATPVSRKITVIDSTSPTFVFGTNGNATYGTTRSTTVTANDPDSGVQIASLEYQWTTSTTAPTLASFTLPFTNGGTITSPVGVSGTYYLWVTATDQVGNNSIVGTNVFNLDNEKPVLTLVNNSIIYVSKSSNFVDFGATANDIYDQSINSKIIKTSNLNINLAGSYTISYNVTDTAGNVANTINRTVNVVETTATYGFTGNVQTVIVPIGISKVLIETWGAQGGSQGQSGGRGGYSKAVFDVTPGDILYVYVGGTNTNNIGGYNGGGSAPNNTWGRGGGGATDVRLNGQNLSNRIIVAGGGGGAAEYGGGNGGGLTGTMVYDGVGGYGGTQASGGLGVSVYQGSSSPGGLGYGGSSGCVSYCGGAGGGGYYGGGGGKGGDDGSAVGGGGGGSGYIKPGATLTDMQTGIRTGGGQARIDFVSGIIDFAYTGSSTTFTVKTNRVMIEAWGAQGGTSEGFFGQNGGLGGYSKAIFTVTPGDILYVYAGGTTTTNIGGYNGGASAANTSLGKGGGGATDVRLNGQNLSNRMIVAGGGGGAAEYGGGNGGGLTGTMVYDGVGGYGGTQASGGAGVSVYQGSSSSGGLGSGGTAGCYIYCGGGGGGGYYGGGGGKGGDDDTAVGGGGGGSGYIKPGATLTDMQTGIKTGNGFIRITELN